MNITSFKANFDGGYRPSLFKVQLNFPLGVGGNAGRQAEFLCKGAQIPDATIGVIDVAYKGRIVHVAGEKQFPEVNLTFYADQSFNIREAFERWQALMNSHEGNIGVVNPNLYKADIYVTALARDGRALKTYKLVGAFPTNISAIDLDYSSADTIGEFSCTLAIDMWQTEQIK